MLLLEGLHWGGQFNNLYSINVSYPGWWLQTFLFSIIYGIILPIDELLFFKIVIAPPASIIRRLISHYHGLLFHNVQYLDGPWD